MQDTPNQSGKLAIVTGANTGLGYETVMTMAKKGLKVVMACRSVDRAEKAKASILVNVPDADLEVLQIDLSDMASVRRAAEEFRCNHHKLDILVNNAGIISPKYSKTEDGFESQMAANCLGHFLFTSLLIDLIPDSPESRITWLSSSAHKAAKINFDDIHFEKKYTLIASYGQSKLMCLMYALELDQRLKSAGKTIKSNVAHPGGAHTDLNRSMPKWLYGLLKCTILPFITHSAADGALPTLQAALSSTAEGGQYYGPQGFLEMSGPSGIATVAEHAKDVYVSKKVWELSEQLTGAIYQLS